jgi:hypothetical protein
MRGHRASGSTSRLMEGDIQSIVGPSSPHRTSVNAWTKHTLPSAHIRQAYIDQKRTTRNQVPLWLFVACCVCFVVITLTLSLVLGLERISRPQNTLASVSFDYNSYYGISKNLNVVHIDKLINSTELNLRTGFVASADTTTRDYTFNITQGIAAPD